jgi:hypothetical protein
MPFYFTNMVELEGGAAFFVKQNQESSITHCPEKGFKPISAFCNCFTEGRVECRLFLRKHTGWTFLRVIEVNTLEP